MNKPTVEDIVDRIKRREAEGMAGLSEVLARQEIERLRGLLWEVMSCPEAAYHGDWFARATELLPPENTP